MLNTIFIVILIATFVVASFRTVYGACFFLFVRILVPEIARVTIGSADTSLNSAMALLLLLFLIRDVIKDNKKIFLKDRYAKNILFFTLGFFFILIFSDFVNFNFQLWNLVQFIITDFLPPLIFICAIVTEKDLKITISSLYWSTLVCCVYGVLTVLIGSNPYINFFYYIFSYENVGSEILSQTLNMRSGIMGTSSTFIHNNAWGYFLPIVFATFFIIDKEKPKKKYKILLVLVSVCVFISAKRSAIISYMSFWLFYLIIANNKRKLKFIFFAIASCLFIVILIECFPIFKDARAFLESSIFFWNDKLRDQNDIGGSSMALRLDQITYCFTEVKKNILFGKGFGWTRYYLDNIRDFHPRLAGFENIISFAVCNGGIFGLFLWFYMIFRSYKYSIANTQEKKFYSLLSLVQLVIAMATGFDYFVYYGIFSIMLNRLYLIKKIPDSNV